MKGSEPAAMTREKPAKQKKRVAGQGEMLMPITGGGKGKAKEGAKPGARRKAG